MFDLVVQLVTFDSMAICASRFIIAGFCSGAIL